MSQKVTYTIEILFPDNVDAQNCAEVWLRDLNSVRPEIIKSRIDSVESF